MNRQVRIIALVMLALARGAAAAPPPAPATGKVVSVHDGDTITFRSDAGETLKVRLHGIDAPEIGQAFGTKARDALAEIAKGKQASVVPVDKDKYGRVVVGDAELNREQVARGMAWRYSQYDKRNEFGEIEAEARRHRRGLWADAHTVPPWEWRRTERERKEAARGARARK